MFKFKTAFILLWNLSVLFFVETAISAHILSYHSNGQKNVIMMASEIQKFAIWPVIDSRLETFLVIASEGGDPIGANVFLNLIKLEAAKIKLNSGKNLHVLISGNCLSACLSILGGVSASAHNNELDLSVSRNTKLIFHAAYKYFPNKPTKMFYSAELTAEWTKLMVENGIDGRWMMENYNSLFGPKLMGENYVELYPEDSRLKGSNYIYPEHLIDLDAFLYLLQNEPELMKNYFTENIKI